MANENRTGVNRLEDFAPNLRPVLEEALEGMEFFEQLTRNDAARVPEPIFVEHLLPVLTNRETRQDLTIWKEVAGNVMRPLDIIDPQSGEVLFRVPPILRQIHHDFRGKGRNSVFEIIRTAEQKRLVLPALGTAHLRQHLVDRIGYVPAEAEDVIAWNEILKRYGYPPLLKTETQALEDSKGSDNGRKGGDDDIEILGYDDF